MLWTASFTQSTFNTIGCFFILSEINELFYLVSHLARKFSAENKGNAVLHAAAYNRLCHIPLRPAKLEGLILIKGKLVIMGVNTNILYLVNWKRREQSVDILLRVCGDAHGKALVLAKFVRCSSAFVPPERFC